MMFCLTAPVLTGHGLVLASVAIRPRMTVARIQDVVAKYYDIPAMEMVSARRSREVARPRQIAMFLAKELTPKSLPDIGRRFGGRDHTTVIHAIKQVTRLAAIDAEISDDLAALRASLDGPFNMRNSLNSYAEQTVKTQGKLAA